MYKRDRDCTIQKKKKNQKKNHRTETRTHDVQFRKQTSKPLRYLHHIQELHNPPSQIRFLPSIGSFIAYANVDE